MFDNTPPQQQPGIDPRDMFDDGQQPQSPSPLQPNNQQQSFTPPTSQAQTPLAETTMPPLDEEPTRSFPLKPVLIGVGALVLIGGVAAAAFFALPQLVKKNETVAPAVQEQEKPIEQELSDIPPQEGDETPTPPTQEQMPQGDDDGDGLDNAEEERLKTDRANPDSDNDGLTDREESVVYTTNPLNPDTDADGFQDGVEVQGGYNPKGPGKLIQLPTE